MIAEDFGDQPPVTGGDPMLLAACAVGIPALIVLLLVILGAVVSALAPLVR